MDSGVKRSSWHCRADLLTPESYMVKKKDSYIALFSPLSYNNTITSQIIINGGIR